MNVFQGHVELTGYMSQCSAEEEQNHLAGGGENVAMDVTDVEQCNNPCFQFMSEVCFSHTPCWADPQPASANFAAWFVRFVCILTWHVGVGL